MNRILRPLLAALVFLCLFGAPLSPPASAQTRTAMAYVGTWSAGTYNLNDVVVSSGVAYVSIAAANTAVPTNTSFWTALGTSSGGGSITINGVTCTIGSTCTIAAGSIATTSSVLKGNGAGGAVAATAGTDFDAAGAATAAQTAAEAALTGDVAKSAGAFGTTVTGMQGREICATAPTNGQGMVWVSVSSNWCPGSATPPAQLTVYQAATCDGGTAVASGDARYDNQQPVAGCYAPSTTTAAYLAFAPATTPAQYVEYTVALPPFWTGSTGIIEAAAGAYNATPASTTGSLTWEVQYYCTAANAVPGSGTFGSATAVTTAVSSTAGGDTFSSSFTVAANSTNGCPASSSTTPAKLVFRVYRSASDGVASAGWLNAVFVTTGRAQ
jgi:hypothetical protein